jgi:hypothetical protein
MKALASIAAEGMPRCSRRIRSDALLDEQEL